MSSIGELFCWSEVTKYSEMITYVMWIQISCMKPFAALHLVFSMRTEAAFVIFTVVLVGCHNYV